MNCYPIRERKDWFITDRKPTICPHCGAKEVKKSVFGMPSAVLGYPTEKDFYNNKIYLVGCLPDFPTERDWGCRNCDAAFFKNTQENLDALNGIWRRKSEPEPEEKVYKRTEKEKADLMNEVMQKWVKEYKEQSLEIPF